MEIIKKNGYNKSKEVNYMLEMIKQLKKNMILFAAFYLILGIVLVVYPEASGIAICYLVGALAIAYGAIHLFIYFKSEVPVVAYRYDLVQGIIGIGVGIYIIFDPELLISTLPIVLGWIVIVDSIIKVQNSWDLKRMGYERWWMVLIGALITAIFGFMMVFYPFEAYFSVIIFVGISLIVNGICDLVTIFILTKKVKEFKEKAESIIIDTEEIDEE